MSRTFGTQTHGCPSRTQEGLGSDSGFFAFPGSYRRSVPFLNTSSPIPPPITPYREATLDFWTYFDVVTSKVLHRSDSRPRRRLSGKRRGVVYKVGCCAKVRVTWVTSITRLRSRESVSHTEVDCGDSYMTHGPSGASRRDTSGVRPSFLSLLCRSGADPFNVTSHYLCCCLLGVRCGSVPLSSRLLLRTPGSTLRSSSLARGPGPPRPTVGVPNLEYSEH